MAGRKIMNIEGSSMTYDNRQFYIDGAWVDPVEPKDFKVINPPPRRSPGDIDGPAADVDRAVAAARERSTAIPHRPAERSR